MTARQDKRPERRKFFIHIIDLLFQKSDRFRIEGGYFPFIFIVFQGEQRANVKQVFINLMKQCGYRLIKTIDLEFVLEMSDIGIEFVDGAVSLHPDMSFGNPATPQQRGQTLVPGFGVYLHRSMISIPTKDREKWDAGGSKTRNLAGINRNSTEKF